MALTDKPSVSTIQVGANGYTVYNNAPVVGAVTMTRTKVIESSTPGTATETLEYQLAGYPNIWFQSAVVKSSEANLKTYLDSATDALP